MEEREHDEPDGCKSEDCFEEAVSKGYCLAHARHDSDRALAGYRRRQIDEPDINTEALADAIGHAAEDILG